MIFRQLIIVKKIYWFLLFLIHVTTTKAISPEFNDAEIKTALLFNFIKYIEADNFPKKDTLMFGYIGNDPRFVPLFDKMQGKRINKHYIKIMQTTSRQDFSSLDMLFVMYGHNFEISSIYKKILNDQVFLVTDRYQNRREVMVNFIHTEDKVQFEVNSKNINDEGFSISPKLLVLGGTELDMRKLYNETEKSLQSEQEKVQQIENELNKKKAEIENLVIVLSRLHRRNDSLTKILENQSQQIILQKNQLQVAETELKLLADEIDVRKNELVLTGTNLQKKNKEIKELDKKLEQKQQTLEKSINELDLLKTEQEDTEAKLITLQKQIDLQKNAIFIFIAFCLLLGGLIFFIYRNFIIKKKQNIELEKRNSKISNQKAQISQQANDLSISNKKLDEEKKRAEQTLEKLKNAQTQLVAAEKMVSLGQLTSGIAHEINNPVNFISSNIEGLKSIIDDLKKVMETYDKMATPDMHASIFKLKQEIEYDELLQGFDELASGIKLGVDRTKEIVTSLRTFSRVEDDSFVYTNLCEIIDSTITLMGNTSKNRIDIIKQYTEMPSIECMPGKMSQVFMNILINAVQAIPDDGEIIIATRVDEKDGKKYAKISISDNGMGMTEDVKTKIFEPFFTTKEVGEGTGLGMSITYSIIKKHKGFIDIESEIGKGTTFNLYLPY